MAYTKEDVNPERGTLGDALRWSLAGKPAVSGRESCRLMFYALYFLHEQDHPKSQMLMTKDSHALMSDRYREMLKVVN